jgi:hypothetical protein
MVTVLKLLLRRSAFVLSSASLLGIALVQPVAAQGSPSKGIVEVTGYQHLSYLGSVGPVTVVVRGSKAAAIRSALRGLSTTSPGECMESLVAFKVSVATREGARPSYVAAEQDCPTPGVVSISVHGKTTEQLREDCSLRAAVIAALPRGRADGTRRDKNRCSL